MPLTPSGIVPLVAFAAILGGTAFIMFSRVPKAYSVALLTLGIFFVQNFLDPLVAELALVTGPLLAGREWWTPLTYMYLHSGFLHVFGNLLILLTAGPALEDRVGSRWFLAVYFGAGFAAAGAHVALTSMGIVSDLPAVGASGAIFGILTAFAVRYPRERLPITLGFFIVMLPSFLVLLIHLGLNLAIMFQDGFGRGASNVAWYGHFAGYLVGLPAALYFEKRGIDLSRGVGAAPARDFPDVEKLRSLAVTPEMRDMLEKAAKFTGEHPEDSEFVNAWIDRFIARAQCPEHGAPLTRHGLSAYCPHGDYSVDFARGKKSKTADAQ